jgi:hypothetical protein
MQSATSTVVNEVRSGQGISFSDVAKNYPGRLSGRTNPSTVFRWATKGCRAADGTRIRFEACRVGSRLMTSAAAVDRFLASLNAPVISEPQPRTVTQRNRAAEKAAAKLDRMLAAPRSKPNETE